MKRKEATLLGYKFLYDKSGKLITERITTDITKLKDNIWGFGLPFGMMEAIEEE